MNRETAAVFHSHDHASCATSAIKEAEARARSEGIRLTPVRKRALEILLEDHKALGAYEVLQRLSEDGFGAQPPVAYRALDFLVEHGFAHRIERLNAFAACTHSSEDHEPVFFICEACKLVAEAPQSTVRTAIEDLAKTIGFQSKRAHVEVVGLCPQCSA